MGSSSSSSSSAMSPTFPGAMEVLDNIQLGRLESDEGSEDNGLLNLLGIFPENSENPSLPSTHSFPNLNDLVTMPMFPLPENDSEMPQACS